jgi:hypothetical protein
MKVTANIKIANQIKVSNKVKTNNKLYFDNRISINGGAAEKYEETYDVIPKANETQVLNTKNKLLIDDIKVKEIPYYEVSNDKDGMTVIIG